MKTHYSSISSTHEQPYLTFIGQFDSDTKSLRYLPLFGKTRRITEYKDKNDLTARLITKSGDIITEVPLQLMPYCRYKHKAEGFAVRGHIPLKQETAKIEFNYMEAVIETLVVPEHHPKVSWKNEIPKVATGKIQLGWEIHYEGDNSVESIVRFSRDGGKKFSRIADRTSANSIEIDCDTLRGSEQCLLQVVVTDGYHNSSATSEIFEVQRKPVIVHIASDLTDLPISQRSQLLLMGQAYHHDTWAPLGPRQLSWKSSIDGNLGTGELIQRKLSPGTHTITLHAEAGELSNETSSKITVEK